MSDKNGLFRFKFSFKALICGFHRDIILNFAYDLIRKIVL